MPRCAVALLGAALAQSGIELVEVSRCLLLTFKECLEKIRLCGCQRPRSRRHRFHMLLARFSFLESALDGFVVYRPGFCSFFEFSVVQSFRLLLPCALVEMTMVCCSWSGTLCRALVVHSSRTGSGAAGSVIAGSSQSLPDFVPFALPRPPTEAAAAAHSREGRA